jgi:hypothetical protein
MGSAASESVKPGAVFRVRLGERAPSIQVKPVCLLLFYRSRWPTLARGGTQQTRIAHANECPVTKVFVRRPYRYTNAHTRWLRAPRATDDVSLN